MNITVVVLASVGLVLVAAGTLRRSRVPLAEAIGTAGDAKATATDAEPSVASALRQLTARLGVQFRRQDASPYMARLEREILLAGMPTAIRPEEVVGAQVIGALVGAAHTPLLSVAGIADGMLLVALGACLTTAGALVPRVLLRRRGDARQLRLDAQVSDALDLLTLCVEAGLGFDAALASVSESIPDPLGGELRLTVAEMRLGLSRAEALENLRTRSESAALHAAVVALVQADALGTPVGRILAAQAEEARIRRQQLAKERAAKLPVRILLPTVLLVFPPTFVILLGPAMASLHGAF